jgi:regulator of sirC expression with transglutaminase-like and TPR domain
VVSLRSVSRPSKNVSLRVAVEGGVPIDELALMVSRDIRPVAPLERCRAFFDAAARPLLDCDVTLLKPSTQAAMLREQVFLEHAFRGNEEDYYDPRNSDLSEVVERRLGIPITLATVMIAVGRRAGMDVSGVGFPGHFLVQVGGESDHVLVDPFVDGREIDTTHLDQLSTRFLGGPGRVVREHLAPVDARSMLVRLLVNLKHAHERRSAHAVALVACDRLVDLTGAVEFRRDRGMHALALGAGLAALADLEAYLAESQGPPDQAEVERAILRARRGSENVRPS